MEKDLFGTMISEQELTSEGASASPLEGEMDPRLRAYHILSKSPKIAHREEDGEPYLTALAATELLVSAGFSSAKDMLDRLQRDGWLTADHVGSGEQRRRVLRLTREPGFDSGPPVPMLMIDNPHFTLTRERRLRGSDRHRVLEAASPSGSAPLNSSFYCHTTPVCFTPAEREFWSLVQTGVTQQSRHSWNMGMVRPFPHASLRAQTGLSSAHFQERLERFLEAGLLVEHDGCYRVARNPANVIMVDIEMRPCVLLPPEWMTRLEQAYLTAQPFLASGNGCIKRQSNKRFYQAVVTRWGNGTPVLACALLVRTLADPPARHEVFDGSLFVRYYDDLHLVLPPFTASEFIPANVVQPEILPDTHPDFIALTRQATWRQRLVR